MKKRIFVKVILCLLLPCFLISCGGDKKEHMKNATDSRPENAEIRLQFISLSSSKKNTCLLKYYRGKADTLFIYNMRKVVFKQELSPETSDSIFFKSERILSDFPYSKTKSSILDGLAVNLSVSVNYSACSGYWSNLSSIKELPEEVQQMIQFINQQIPKEQALQ